MELTEQMRTELLATATRNEVFKLAVTSAFNHIIITDMDGKIIFANSAAEKITGYSHEEIIGSTPRLWGGQMPPEFYKTMWHTIKDEGKPFEGEINNLRKNGIKYIARAVISPIFDDMHKLIGFIGTEEDITLAKEADRMKTEFVSITAHQLKTPMTVIRWNLELLGNSILSTLDPKNKEYFDAVSQSNLDLISLVDVLLNISRIESGRLNIKSEDIDFKELVDKTLKALESLSSVKHITIKTEYKCETDMKVDKQLVLQTLNNLISNAIKYSPENSEVELNVEKDAKNFTVSVKDHGYGIPEAEKSKIFEKHFRSSNVTEKQIEGNGLGLYFVKLIVDTYKGKIWFDSVQDQGTTFFFTIPLSGMENKEGEVGLN